MSQNTSKVGYKEVNNFKQGKSGSKVPTMPGPAAGNKGKQNPTQKGGIYRPTKGK
jgi:hypothetical protein